MLAALACAILQTSALGADPAVWESKKYGMSMSYPRSWKAKTREHIRHSKNREPSDEIVLFEATDGGNPSVDVEVVTYKTPPKWLELSMPKWPASPAGDLPLAHELPNTVSLDVPVEIGELRGFAILSESIVTITNTRVGCSSEFYFQTPAGKFVTFRGYTLTFPRSTEVATMVDDVDDGKPMPATVDMQKALPIFNAMIQSIALKK